MEGKKGGSCSSPSPSPSPSVGSVSQFHGEERTGKSSSSSGLFNSVFPRPSSVERKVSPHSDIFGPTRKQEYADQAWITGYRTNEGNTSRGSKERTTVYQGERSDPCFLSDSLYYGGQDICAEPPNSHSSGAPYNLEKDGKDDPGNGSDLASRGNWWQGSLYY